MGVDLCFGGELFHTPDVFSGPTYVWREREIKLKFHSASFTIHDFLQFTQVVRRNASSFNTIFVNYSKRIENALT